MLAAIGETLDSVLSTVTETSDSVYLPMESPKHQSLITGVIVSVRPQFYRLSIWTALAPSGTGGAEDEMLRTRIETLGRNFKVNVLGYADGQRLAGPLATEVEFLSHKDSERKGKAKKLIV